MTPDEIMALIDAKRTRQDAEIEIMEMQKADDWQEIAVLKKQVAEVIRQLQELEKLSHAYATIENDLPTDASNEWLHLTIRCRPHATGYMMWGGGAIKAEAKRDTLADMLIAIANELETQE